MRMNRLFMHTFIVASDGPHGEHEQLKSGRSGLLAQALFVLLAVGLVGMYRDRPQFHTLAITFVSIVLEALPFVLLGALVGGLIEVFVPRELIGRWLPEKRAWTIFAAAALGLIFPVCECAIVPVVRRFLRKGVPLGAAVAFLLGGPIVNPLVAASTAVAYYFEGSMVIHRLVFGYLTAAVVGVMVHFLFSIQEAVRPEALEDANGHRPGALPAGGGDVDLKTKFGRAALHAAGDFLDIGRFLVIGAFLAAGIQTLVPRQAFAAVMGTPALSILVMMILAMLLNLCSEADAFVAASFRSTLVPPAAQLAFMVLGPMLDIKLILMMLNVFRVRAIVALAMLTFLSVFVSMVLMHTAIQ